MARPDTVFGLTREERRALAQNPVFQAGFAAASLAILGAAWASTNATPERRAKRRAQIRKRNKSYERQRRESLERNEASSKRRKALLAFFGSGPGKAQYEARCISSYQADQPYPDATFTRQPAGVRQTKFAITSDSAGLELRTDFDSADRAGSVRLLRAGEPIWSITAVFHGGVISPYYGGRDYNPEAATLAANLLAAPGCRFDTITLVHPDSDALRAKIWSEHMRANPKLAEALRWDPDRPLS